MSPSDLNFPISKSFKSTPTPVLAMAVLLSAPGLFPKIPQSTLQAHQPPIRQSYFPFSQLLPFAQPGIRFQLKGNIGSQLMSSIFLTLYTKKEKKKRETNNVRQLVLNQQRMGVLDVQRRGRDLYATVTRKVFMEKGGDQLRVENLGKIFYRWTVEPSCHIGGETLVQGKTKDRKVCNLFRRMDKTGWNV